MKKRISIAMLLAFVLVFSLAAIHAAEVNATGFDDGGDLQLDASDDVSLGDDGRNRTQTASLSDSIYYGGNYEVKLTDLDANESLANKTLDISINGIGYHAKTGDDGVAGVNVGLNPGTYPAAAFFAGDDAYAASNNLSGSVKVLTTIKAGDVTKYYKGTKAYQATYLDSDGNPLKSVKVTIDVNGKKYTKTTNNKGVASLQIDLKPGTYKVSTSNPVTGENRTTAFRILQTVTASDLRKVKGDGKNFVAKFYKSSGKVLSNQKVKVKINGKAYSYKTNSKGQLKLSFNSFKKGTYTVVCCNKDGLSKTSTVKVYGIATSKLTTSSYTFLPGDSKIITVKLTTNLNDDSNCAKTVKIRIGDKTYSKKTDSKGVATLNVASVKKGFYNVEYSYGGTKFVKSSKASNLLTILDTNQSALKIKGTSHFGYGAGTSMKVALTAGGVVLHKRTVTFTIEGKTYTRTTDNNGIASVPIDLKIGNYTVDVKADSKLRVNGTSKSFAIDVFQRAPSKVTWKCGTSYKDSLQEFKVLLTDSNGKAISGGVIELTIDGETHTGKTGSNGYATIRTDVALGKYKVSVEFVGSNDYLPSHTSKSINVKLSKFKGGYNEKNAVSYLSAYLKATKNCQVNNAKIKALVKSLTSGLTDNIDKAKALFNYVRDNVDYQYYYNTHKGAVKTLNSKGGNCVDQAHLLVAMYRAAGFKARYVHGFCNFYDDGKTYGHVWTQVLIGNTWVVGDPINHANSLGKVKNWNPNTFSLKSRYLAAPF